MADAETYVGQPIERKEDARLLTGNAVFADHDALVAGVMDVAREIATKSPMAIWGTKQTMHYTRDHSVSDGLEFIANWNAAMFDTDDMAEAFGAQMEKRDADFPDLWPLSEAL